MGSRRVGYEYGYGFSMVDEAEIKSKYKKKMTEKGYLFEFRTNFILKRRKPDSEEGVAASDAVVLDSERYDACLSEGGDKFGLYLVAGFRMKEYWMSDDELFFILDEAIDFAKREPPQHDRLIVAVVVDLEVCTVQQDGEPLGACMNRAIRAQNLVPLYLWPYATIEECKPMTPMLLSYLAELVRIRVEDIDEGLALMRVCPICLRNTTIGAQISMLPCDHAFHSHCIVGWLEGNNLCPSCQSPAYHNRIAIAFH